MHQYLAAARLVDAADQVEQRGLAAARRAHQRHVVAFATESVSPDSTGMRWLSRWYSF
jgi:hypothetical protein